MYPVLAGLRELPVVGGAEVQQTILARAFRDYGYRVTVLSYDFGQADACDIDGIRVRKIHAGQHGIPGIRFLHPRLTAVWNAMDSADADIYYQRCAGGYTGVAAAFARRRRRRFVYAAAHDHDLLPGSGNIIGSWRERQIYTFGLRRADAVVVQNPVQARSYRLWMGRPAVMIPSCHAAAPGAAADRGGVVLWVGMMRPWKRPELFLELARRLPALRFRMIGGPSLDQGEEDYYTGIERAARQLPNLEFVGFVPYADIDRHFDAARVFVNTSAAEGFPNTFLQAWARAIPTLSFLDCGARDAEGEIGQRVSNLDRLARALEDLMHQDEVWQEQGARCRRYFASHHSVQAAADAYRRLFCTLLEGEGMRRGIEQESITWR
jgi:glycosyltransferase involved in cell wall biosynthesis